MQHGLSEEKIRGCVPPSRGDAAVEYARRFLRPPSSPLLSEGSSESSNGAKDSVMQEVVEFLTGARELLEDWAFAQLLNTLLLYHKHVISTDELTLRVRYIYETVVEYQEYSDQNVMSEPSEFSEKAAFSFEMFSRFCPSGVEKLFSGG
mmetsp:Transcript_8790/g.13154  ORF Transcript_8790/g.13154 Transcript_8790/m.13154 type:complete len:149 (-) Transcript_8790:217-663(-)